MALKTNIPVTASSASRVRLWHALIVVVLAIFGLRLFYVQVIRYDYYKTAALDDQLKQYSIPASRGLILAHSGDSTVPIVLNQKLYTLFVDPTFVKNPDQYASAVVKLVGGQPSDYLKQMRVKHSRYQILAKKLTKQQSEQVRALKLPGLGTEEQEYRLYPQNQLASQLLGFVNADGQGRYGIEQALNRPLSGTPGQLKAITDVHGVPLAASKDNIQKPAQAGKNVVLSIDMAMQVQMEKILQSQAQATKSKLLSAVIMDPSTGQVKAMANYPTYNASRIGDIKDPSVLQNAAVSNAIEPGSIMKTFTAAAGLDQGAFTPTTTFYDPAKWTVNNYTIHDIEEDGGARQQSVASTLALSLNTGATWMLMQMGGGQINSKGITAWHDYMANHYLFGHDTGIEQGYESAGLVPSANMKRAAIQLTYANSSFGQGMTMTAIQAAGAMSAMVNGGTYYQPTLVDGYSGTDGAVTKQQPKVLKSGVVSAKTSAAMSPLMQQVVTHYLGEGFSFMKFDPQYIVGGKTGTAQVAQPGGGYSATAFNGTYAGFVGGDTPQYVIVVFNNEPQVSGYAGSRAGQPVFADLAHMLINNGFVTPKTSR